MSTDTDLRERLRDLADHAPHGTFSGAELWRSGVRRQRRRTAGAVAAVVAVVALVAGLGLAVQLPQTAPEPAEVPFEELAIPRTVHPPDPWSEGTAELGPPGPLAAIGDARRHATDGFSGTNVSAQLFGVSAADGSSRFLDLPGDVSGSDLPGNFGVALSPDGSRVAVTRYRGPEGADRGIAGWDVYDTVTGETVELRVPGMRRIDGTDAFEIEFTGDSRYLMTNFSLSGRGGSRNDSLVVWDVDTGEFVVAEGEGHRWLPNPGSGPTGVVWSRGNRIITFEPATGATKETTTSRDAFDPWYSPDGATLAYLGRRPTRPNEYAPMRLRLIGADGSGDRRIPVDGTVGDILGWRGDGELVVSEYGPRRARVVDIATGRSRPLRLDRLGSHGMTAEYAADLWRNDLVEGTAQPDAHDPRIWLCGWFWVALSGLGLVGGLALWRRRGRP